MSAEKHLSHSAVLTAIVRAIWIALSKVGNAALNGANSPRTSPAISMSAFSRVHFAKLIPLIANCNQDSSSSLQPGECGPNSALIQD